MGGFCVAVSFLRSDWSHPAICRDGGQLFNQAPEPGWRPARREVAIQLG